MDENRPDAALTEAETEQENKAPETFDVWGDPVKTETFEAWDEADDEAEDEADDGEAAEDAEAPEKKKKPAKKRPAEKSAEKPAKKSGKKPQKQQTKKRSKTASRVLTVILTLLLVVLAVLVFVFRDELTRESLRRTFGKESAVSPAKEAFTYETGAAQVFASAGDGLAVACSSSVQLLDAKGHTVYKQVVSYDTPAVFACADQAMFCDLGGTECIIAGMDGESVILGADGSEARNILTASMNGSGWFVLVTEEPGYKGLVSVYNADCEKQYEWWSGTGYVLRTAVSPDNRFLSVLCADKEGTKLHVFALNSETERAGQTFADTLFYDLYYMNNDTICLVGETGLCCLDADGTVKNTYDVGDSYLLDYEFGQNFVTLFVSDYRSGGGGTLVTLDGKAGVLGTETLERDVVSLSAQGKQLLVMTADGLALYDQALVRRYANETLMTEKRALLRPSGDVLLLSAYSAERFSF